MRVALPVNDEKVCFCDGPTMMRSGSPPCVKIFCSTFLTCASVKARCVPSVGAVPGTAVYTGSVPLAPRSELVASQPSSPRVLRAVAAAPEAVTLFCVSIASMSRFSSSDFSEA